MNDFRVIYEGFLKGHPSESLITRKETHVISYHLSVVSYCLASGSKQLKLSFLIYSFLSLEYNELRLHRGTFHDGIAF